MLFCKIICCSSTSCTWPDVRDVIPELYICGPEMNLYCLSCLPLFASAAAWKHTSNTHLIVHCLHHTGFHEQVKSLEWVGCSVNMSKLVLGLVCAGRRPHSRTDLLCQLGGMKVGSTEPRMGLLPWHGQPPYQKQLHLPPASGGRCPCAHGLHMSWNEMLSAARHMRS